MAIKLRSGGRISAASEVCSLDDFSAFAEQLDNLQEQYLVSFVISAGNYDTVPLLTFAAECAQLESGRITCPADSVAIGIAVGTILQRCIYRRTATTGRRLVSLFPTWGGPSYSHRPGSCALTGGSCSTDTTSISGVCSVLGGGAAHGIRTSFAAPLVARSLAQVPLGHPAPLPAVFSGVAYPSCS